MPRQSDAQRRVASLHASFWERHSLHFSTFVSRDESSSAQLTHASLHAPTFVVPSTHSRHRSQKSEHCELVELQAVAMRAAASEARAKLRLRRPDDLEERSTGAFIDHEGTVGSLPCRTRTGLPGSAAAGTEEVRGPRGVGAFRGSQACVQRGS
jgi:hypothetical protein